MYLYNSFTEASEFFIDLAEIFHIQENIDRLLEIEFCELTGKEKNNECKRISEHEYREKIEKHFEIKWGFEVVSEENC